MPNPGLANKINELLSSVGPSSWPTAAAPANDVTYFAALRYLMDATRKSGGTALASSKSVVDALGSDGTTITRTNGSNIAGEFLALPRCVVKTGAAVAAATTALFTITGGPVRATIYGIVTTVLVGTGNGKLTTTTTAPAATVDVSAAAVAYDNLAAGTSIRHINTTAILTKVTAGFVMCGNAFATDDTEFLFVPGSIGFNGTGAVTGGIDWYMMYTPLSPSSLVVAA